MYAQAFCNGFSDLLPVLMVIPLSAGNCVSQWSEVTCDLLPSFWVFFGWQLYWGIFCHKTTGYLAS